MLAVRFSVDAFRQVQKVALCAYFSEIFFFFFDHERVSTFVEGYLRMDYMIVPFSFLL